MRWKRLNLTLPTPIPQGGTPCNRLHWEAVPEKGIASFWKGDTLCGLKVCEVCGIYFTLFSILVNVFSMNKKQINNNNNDQVLDGYVIKLRLIVELHITHSRLENIRWYQ